MLPLVLAKETRFLRWSGMWLVTSCPLLQLRFTKVTVPILSSARGPAWQGQGSAQSTPRKSVAPFQSQQSSEDDDGELSLAAATYNSHSSHIVEVPVDFLDTALSGCDARTLFEGQSVQGNRSATERADPSEAGTCAQAAACRVASVKVVAESGRWQTQWLQAEGVSGEPHF